MIQLRQRKEAPINYPHRDENILLERVGSPKMKKTVSNKNKSQMFDRQVYELIEKCTDIYKIPWKHIATEK